MKTTEIIGYQRKGTGKGDSKRLRAEGNVPCVLYGEGENLHFHSPMYLFKDLLYTPDAYIVNLNVEGAEKRCVLQDVQFHPVSEIILHADFLAISDDKPVTIDVPVKLKGDSPGAQAGGQVYVKNKRLRVKALPENLPEYVEVDISEVQLGNAVRVKDLTTDGFEILNNENVAIVQIIIPRALKAAASEEEEELEEGEEGAEGEAPAAEGGEAPAAPAEGGEE